jgi:hypothetical protein
MYKRRPVRTSRHGGQRAGSFIDIVGVNLSQLAPIQHTRRAYDRNADIGIRHVSIRIRDHASVSGWLRQNRDRVIGAAGEVRLKRVSTTCRECKIVFTVVLQHQAGNI